MGIVIWQIVQCTTWQVINHLTVEEDQQVCRNNLCKWWGGWVLVGHNFLFQSVTCSG
ncbi:hypothetical protein BOX15_Mlig014207g1 [Macrostomum lignano]|uniref:Uncharacterized protein n=1 Tax=Macrostomum lignano TaxID=282301 RepID=A0A267E6M7_9PLAT|nr:hypothetical protein BOX15_Mlig014207g2 [Macrostomum lignano]PAA56463.1 hypothetical protein BOX15_Mlig014207g1 [Macrostomum lignano]